jgi:hypothetical protein
VSRAWSEYLMLTRPVLLGSVPVQVWNLRCPAGTEHLSLISFT